MRSAGVVCLALWMLAVGAASGQSVTAVPKLDEKLFATGWYEIARLPNKPEKKCVSNALQMYTVGNKPWQFQVVESCLLKDGEANVRNLSGRGDKVGDGRLKVGSFPFATKTWVLATAPDYSWALVGSPNHKLLWILSRTATMDEAVLQQVEGMAAAQGYKVDKLQRVVQGK